MSEPTSDQPKKIIIDEDWKSQVEREKEELRHGPAKSQASTGDAELPPASLAFLVTSLVTQTMAALGQLPDPLSQEYQVSLPLAKLHIDLLAVLQEKTKGNLAPEEQLMLDESLHQLRMLFVAVRDKPPRETSGG
jgi:hypothetical protein